MADEQKQASAPSGPSGAGGASGGSSAPPRRDGGGGHGGGHSGGGHSGGGHSGGGHSGGGHSGPRREGGPGGGAGGPGGPRRGKRQYFRKKKVCKFCVEKMDFIDYKRADILSQFVQERGKILPRRMTGVCSRHQRWLGVAIKRARNIALLPFAGSAAGTLQPRQATPQTAAGGAPATTTPAPATPAPAAAAPATPAAPEATSV
jgi:small subunit ribosomal protein S18